MEEEKSVCKEKAFDEVYKSYAQSLRGFVFFKCRDEARSFDIVQESFIKLWENCAKVSPAKAKSYLYTVANNKFLNIVAHQKVRYKYAESKTARVDNKSPDYILEEQEFGDKLQRALDGLTELQREAFLMSRVEGKKYREIAEALGITEKTAGKRVLDALERLRLTIDNI